MDKKIVYKNADGKVCVMSFPKTRVATITVAEDGQATDEYGEVLVTENIPPSVQFKTAIPVTEAYAASHAAECGITECRMVDGAVVEALDRSKRDLWDIDLTDPNGLPYVNEPGA